LHCAPDGACTGSANARRPTVIGKTQADDEGGALSDLDGLAVELDQRARSIELIGDQLVHAAAIALWSSVAADAFRASVVARHRACTDVEGLLRSAARVVRDFAADAEAEKQRLRRLEAAAIDGVGRVISLVSGL
jgi:hypothetical protein